MFLGYVSDNIVDDMRNAFLFVLIWFFYREIGAQRAVS